MIDLDLLKLTNLFNPQPSPTFPFGASGTVNASMPPDQNQPDLMSAISGLLNPKEEQFQRYSDLLNQMPQRADYKPSKLRQIGGFLAGIGSGGPVGIANGQVVGYKSSIPAGLEAQRAITDQPYNQALTDWANQVEPVSKIAQMESSRNVNNRATALGTLQRQQAQEKLDETEKQNVIRNEQKDKEIQIKADRAKAYIDAKNFAITHPEYEGKVDRNGILHYVNKTDPTDIVTTDIDTGKLGDIEKSELNIKGKLQTIAAQSKASQALESQREANREKLEKEKYPTGRPQASQPKGNTPTQDRIAFGNRANQVIIDHPEWSKYIKIDKGVVSVTPPGRFTGPSQEVYDQIKNALKGIQPEQTHKTQQTQPRELSRPEDPRIKAAKAKVEPGYVLITDGKSFGQVKPSDVSKLPNGWMVVK